MNKRPHCVRRFSCAAVLFVASLLCAASFGRPLPAASAHEVAVAGGAVVFRLDTATLESIGLRFVAHGPLDGAADADHVQFPLEEASTIRVDPLGDPVLEGRLYSRGAFLIDGLSSRVVIGNLELAPGRDGLWRVHSTLGDEEIPCTVFTVTPEVVDTDLAGGVIRLIGSLAITDEWAMELGLPEAAGLEAGALVVEIRITSVDDFTDRDRDMSSSSRTACRSLTEADAARSTTPVGPDVIVADLQSLWRYNPVIGVDITAFSVGTTACNLGSERANWIQYTNDHPVIFQAAYRLKDDHFEQIGMSWLKHGFYAVSESLCMPCLDPTDGSQLGVGCSDPYSATLNGIQNNMSPRDQLNPHTGYFVYPHPCPDPPGPPCDPPWGDAETKLDRRLQIHNADLNPDVNPDSTYFIQGHYITADDALAGNNDNNASYRQVDVYSPQPGEYRMAINDSYHTQRGQAGIRAWRDYDPSVTETEIRVPNEGLLILAAKATDTGAGTWRYAYALQNLNSDRAVRSFTVEFPEGTIISHIGFHDVDYHSGDSYEGSDWPGVIGDRVITWSTETFEENESANALRYDTTYNFYFEANVEPAAASVVLGLFKPGAPMELTASTIGPKLDLIDCNRNDIPDLCDITCDDPTCEAPCGVSSDCNANGVPDECEPDCNENGIADACDISNCPPGELACADCNDNLVPDECEVDCDGDGIPDECDTFDDTDGDGIVDCYDLCPETTPAGACVCPDVGRCCWDDFCLDNFPRVDCIGSSGTPDCLEAPCRQGCLLGDADKDGDLDMHDVCQFQICFSGASEMPGFTTPPQECSIPLDFDGDDDIDHDDLAHFDKQLHGP